MHILTEPTLKYLNINFRISGLGEGRGLFRRFCLIIILQTLKKIIMKQTIWIRGEILKKKCYKYFPNDQFLKI